MGKFGKDIIVRALTGAALVIVVLGALLTEYTFIALMLVIGIGSLWEFYRLSRHAGASPQISYSIFLGALMVLMAYAILTGWLDWKYALILVPLIFIVFFIELYRKKENPIFNISVSLGGLFYTVIPVILLTYMAFAGREHWGYGYSFVLIYILLVWTNDVFAYLCGVALGKHKLFERISPKKSWEGFIGGVIFATGGGVLAGWLQNENLYVWGGLGLLIAVTAVFGDLVESLFKRSVDVKDSGRIMPGHGGFLDRFDALLLSAPFVFVYFIIFVA